MIWKKYPHIPWDHEKIMVEYEGLKGRIYPLTVTSGQTWNHISKWCFEEEWKEAFERKQKEKA